MANIMSQSSFASALTLGIKKLIEDAHLEARKVASVVIGNRSKEEIDSYNALISVKDSILNKEWLVSYGVGVRGRMGKFDPEVDNLPHRSLEEIELDISRLPKYIIWVDPEDRL